MYFTRVYLPRAENFRRKLSCPAAVRSRFNKRMTSEMPKQTVHEILPKGIVVETMERLLTSQVPQLLDIARLMGVRPQTK